LGKALDNIEAIALTVFEAVKKLLTTAQVALSLDDQFIDTMKTATTLTALAITSISKNYKLTRSS
jgi:hypothetical protein